MVIDELARRHDASFRSKFNGRVADLRIDDHRVALLKPETYMNESGRSISAATRFYKAAPPTRARGSRRRGPRVRSLPGALGRRARGPQRACGRSRRRSAIPGSSGSASVSGVPDAVIRAMSRTSCSRHSTCTRIATRWSRALPTPSRPCWPTVLTRLSDVSTSGSGSARDEPPRG